jgi:hypothetical protein
MVYIEDKASTVHHQLKKFQADPEYVGPKFYPIIITNGVPSIGAEVELKQGPRAQRAVVEVQELVAGGQKVAEVDVEV